MEETDEILQLGGNIELSGFSSLDGGTMIVLKKIVGNYARKFSSKCTSFEKLCLTLKPVHGKDSKYEVHGLVVDRGKTYSSEVTDYNLFVVLDSVLKKIEAEMS